MLPRVTGDMSLSVFTYNLTIRKYIREVLDTHHQLVSRPHYRPSCSVAFLEFDIVLAL